MRLSTLFGLQLLRRSLSDVALRLQTEQGKLFSTSAVGLQSIETLKATAGESDFFAKWSGYHARAINSEQKLAIYQGSTIDLLPAMLLSLTSAAVLGVGALRVIDGHLSIGTLVAFQGLLISFSAPVQELVGVAGRAQQASADLSRLDDVLQHRRDWRFTEAPDAPPVARAAGRLSLQGVRFGYSSSGPRADREFSTSRRSRANGSRWWASPAAAKSTLGKLVTGLFEPQAGQILIDGYSLRSWGRERLSNIVTSVDQDIRLFSGTIHDNVTLWDDTVDHGRLVAAVDDAGLTSAVQNLTGNFQAIIEEGGRNLNGGQRQRVEIASALIREPAILVLDEATAALDAASEHEILTAVRRRGMTCILVAHRLSTIRDCDEIIVLERGKGGGTRNPYLPDGERGGLRPADPAPSWRNEHARTARHRYEVAGTRNAYFAWPAVATVRDSTQRSSTTVGHPVGGTSWRSCRRVRRCSPWLSPACRSCWSSRECRSPTRCWRPAPSMRPPWTLGMPPCCPGRNSRGAMAPRC